MAVVVPFNVESQTLVRKNFADGTSLVFVGGYATGAMRGDNANGPPNPNDPNSFPNGMAIDDIIINIPNVAVNPQATVSAVASLADIFNANQSVNARYTIRQCRAQVVGGGQLQLVVSMGVNDIDGYIYRIAFHITASG